MPAVRCVFLVHACTRTHIQTGMPPPPKNTRKTRQTLDVCYIHYIIIIIIIIIIRESERATERDRDRETETAGERERNTEADKLMAALVRERRGAEGRGKEGDRRVRRRRR
jgi:hypothetical protein